MSKSVGLGVRPSGGFRRAEVFCREKSSVETTFSARHFAARRAGFLLRELARQYEQPPSQELSELTTITPAVTATAVPADGAGEIAAPVPPVPAGPSPEEIEHLVTEAEERGRSRAMAELTTALDQAISALDAAGRNVVQMQGEIERQMVVPLAQASLHIGSELARQALLDAPGLGKYLDAVAASMANATEGRTESPIVVHMNPGDLAILERASRQPEFLRFISDPLVPSGGVTASSGDKVADDRFENRLREIRELVLAVAADIRREGAS